MATPTSVLWTASIVTTPSSTHPITTSALSAATARTTTGAPTVPATTIFYTAIVSAIQAAVRREIDSAVARALLAVLLSSSVGSAALTLPSTKAASGTYLLIVEIHLATLPIPPLRGSSLAA
uniref:Uncharacterized protein n=1 Tax=Amphimedon queenslandica TaxID=400682 RepID=A0A1X7UJ22_AMPQE